MTGLDFVTLKAMKKAKLTVSRVCVCSCVSHYNEISNTPYISLIQHCACTHLAELVGCPGY